MSADLGYMPNSMMRELDRILCSGRKMQRVIATAPITS
jgi:hypothetical protein